MGTCLVWESSTSGVLLNLPFEVYSCFLDICRATVSDRTNKCNLPVPTLLWQCYFCSFLHKLLQLSPTKLQSRMDTLLEKRGAPKESTVMLLLHPLFQSILRMGNAQYKVQNQWTLGFSGKVYEIEWICNIQKKNSTWNLLIFLGYEK